MKLSTEDRVRHSDAPVNRNFMPVSAAGQRCHDEMIRRQNPAFDDGCHRPMRSFECAARPLRASPAIRPGTQPFDRRSIFHSITLHGDS
jgi:hypothetical protein